MLFEKFAALTEFVNTHKKETISKKKLNKRKDGRDSRTFKTYPSTDL